VPVLPVLATLDVLTCVPLPPLALTTPLRAAASPETCPAASRGSRSRPYGHQPAGPGLRRWTRS
jgi:hypothetical protein